MDASKKKILFIRFLFLLCLFCILITNPGSGSISAKVYDRELDWQVLDAKHFSVIFPAKNPSENSFNYHEMAIQIADIAEETYQQVTPQFGEPYQSDKKITIILEDFSDSVYGFASVIPHRTIRLNLSAPGSKSFNTKFESWLKILITHEYTHLAHFDMTNKGTTFLRFFLGQIIAPNALQPLWSIEGLAIYNESKWSTGGRLKDSRYEMYLRSDFQENDIKSLDQIQGSYLVSWPGGNTPYIYGQSLIHFISQQFGEEKLIEISKEFCTFPYLGMNRALKKTLGIDQNDLFKKWKDYQSTQYQQQIEQVSQLSNLTESRQLTDHQYWVDDPLWLLDPYSDNLSASLLYKVHTPNLYTTIREYDIDKHSNNQENILIHRTSGFGTSYSVSPDQQYLIYSKLTQYEQYYSYYDLYLYHLNSKKQFRISEGMRLKDPAWHPDPQQNKIAAVVNLAGSNNLVLFSLETFILNNYISKDENAESEKILSKKRLLSFSDLTYLTDFNDGTQISQPVWSPLGNQIAFSLWHSGYQDLYILTLDHQDQILSCQAITRDHYTDISPSWSSDGKLLFFSSDRTGIYNLYAYDLEKKKLFLLTNVTTGAFEPSLSPNGQEMAFIQYHSSGYELHLIHTEQLLWKSLDQPFLDLSAPQPVNHYQKLSIPTSQTGHTDQNQTNFNHLNKESSYSFHEYSPLDSILPTYWTPYLSITSQDLYLGFSSVAQDQLKFYTIPFKLAYGIVNHSLYYDFYFTSNKNNPSLSFSWQGETSFSSQIETTIHFLKEGYTSAQDTARYYYQQLSLGFQSEKNPTGGEKTDAEKSMERINSLNIEYHYSDTESYPASIGPEIGKQLLLSYQHANQKIGSDLTYHKILWDSRKYFPLFAEQQVLVMRLVAGTVFGTSEEQDHFFLGGNNNDSLISSNHSGSFPLRGFPSSSFSGNHLLLTSMEYRFPIRTIEHKIGFDWASIFLERITGTLFLDVGYVWNKPLEFNQPILPQEEINISLGIEFNFKFNQSDDPFIITIGAGKAITKKNQFQFYVQTGLSF